MAVNTEFEAQIRKERIEALINRVGNIQNEILRYGYLVRGAIVEGDFFHNDVIVYGKALVNAVNDEEQIAIYTRVIVQKDIVELLPHYFIMDEDNLGFLNQFIFSHALEYVNFKHQLLEMLKKNPDKKHKQKIMWIINYYNNYLSFNKAKLSVKIFIKEQDINAKIEDT